MSCLICSLHKSKKFMVKETPLWRVDESFDIKLKGLYFIKPKRHIEGPEELDENECRELGSLIQEFSLKSKKETKAKKIIVFSLGFKVPHLHFWIIPVTSDTLPHILKISKAVKDFSDFYRRETIKPLSQKPKISNTRIQRKS